MVELKYHKTAEAAIGQIKDRKYPEILKDDSGEAVLVGENCEKEKKEGGHSCKTERVNF